MFDLLRGDAAEPPYGAVAALIRFLRTRAIEVKPRAVHYWFSEGRKPRGAERIVPLIAEYLRVSPTWLASGKDTPVEYEAVRPASAEESPSKIHPKARRIIYAIGDPETRDFLNDQLDVFERLRAQARRTPA